jgi:hypothetical protein
MNEELAIEILKKIKDGNSFGYQVMFREIQETEKFFNLQIQEYGDTITQLVKDGCILNHPDPNQRNGYIINEKRDCLTFYINKQIKTNSEINFKEQIDRLTIKNLELSNQLIPLQHKELKQKKIFALIGAIGGIILTLLAEYVKNKVWLPCQ